MVVCFEKSRGGAVFLFWQLEFRLLTALQGILTCSDNAFNAFDMIMIML